MTSRIFSMAILATCVLATTAAMGSSRHHGRHAHVARAPAHPFVAVPYGSGAPHMIEARPGVWISNWDCITDEGQGRWMPCSASGGGGN